MAINILILIILSIIFIFSKSIFDNKALKLNRDIKNDHEYYNAVIIVILFIIFFVLFFRVIRLFFSSTVYFDFFFWASFIYFISIEYKFLGFIVLIILYFLRKYLFLIIKINFIKIYHIHFDILGFYTYFLRKKYIYCNRYAKFLYFWLFKIIVLYIVIKSFIFNEGMIYVGWLPWYALYYFIVSVSSFFLRINLAFDIGCRNIYNQKIKFSDAGIFKINEYKKYLIFNFSKYNFCDFSELKYVFDKANTLYLVVDFDYKNA